MAAGKPVIYQLVVRYFGNLNTTNQRDGTRAINGCGRFEDINEAALASLHALGVTHLWLAGCLRQATLTAYPDLDLPADDPDVVKGIAGSFYAVRDYFDVCPDYAREPARRMAEFQALVKRIHDAGMAVLMDLVPNHVARGYHSIVRPESDFGAGDDARKFFDRDNHFFYLTDPLGQTLRLARPAHWNPPGVTFDGRFPPEDGLDGRVPRVSGDNVLSAAPGPENWYETVKLNYGFHFVTGTTEFHPRPRTWEAMDHILAFWQSRGVDGFRCDMAHLVPRPAWEYLIAKARERQPGCMFVAEAYPTSDPGYPVTNVDELTAAGFDAFYHSEAYRALKRIYQGRGSLDDYDRQITSLSMPQRASRLGYLENHDERRVASPLVLDSSDGESGFGTADAGFQLAPLQFLFGPGPVLLYNGQEVGEPGAGIEGFNANDGRTTFFDYWCMPEFVKWVHGHAYDGGRLSAVQKALRHFYSGLLDLCQDPAVRADGYWGLRYYNRPDRFPDCSAHLYTFARYEARAGRLLVVAANFRAGEAIRCPLRIPPELAAKAALPPEVDLRLVLDRAGVREHWVARQTTPGLATDGFAVDIPNQSCHVYVLE